MLQPQTYYEVVSSAPGSSVTTAEGPYLDSQLRQGCSFRDCIHIGCSAHPASWIHRVFFPTVKRPGFQGNHSSSSTAEGESVYCHKFRTPTSLRRCGSLRTRTALHNLCTDARTTGLKRFPKTTRTKRITGYFRAVSNRQFRYCHKN